MNERVMRELKIVVERAVRPVRASHFRKQRMREELLEHLTGIYEEEARRLGDEEAALEHARRRFGDPGELAEEIDRSVPRRDWLRHCLELVEHRPGESLLRLAVRHSAWGGALMTTTLLVMLPLVWARGRMGEIGLLLHIILVMGVFSAALTFVLVVFSERIGRALYGRESERSVRAAAWYCLGSLFVFPTMTAFVYWGLLGDLAAGLSGFLWACLVAPATPVLFIAMARQTADELREREEWASLEVGE